MEDSQLKALARRQLEDYDRHEPGTAFADGLALDVDTAYALQEEVARLRQERGDRPIGYKVGCTSARIRQQLSIDHCVFGRLFQTECCSSGAELTLSEFCHLAIEGELAVQLAREPEQADFVGRGLPPCVARVFPVIELHNLVFRGSQPTAGELIGNNAIHAGCIMGAGGGEHSEAENWSLRVLSNDQMLGATEGDGLLDTIKSSLKWLSCFLESRERSLQEGDIVLTGSIPNLFPVRDPCRVMVQTAPFGDVVLKVTR